MQPFDLIEQRVHGWNGRAAHTEVNKIRSSEYIGMAFEGGDFTAVQDQHAIEVRLQFADGFVVGSGVVAGDRDEIEASGRGGFEYFEYRTRNRLSVLADP